jgi:heme peroxidase
MKQHGNPMPSGSGHGALLRGLTTTSNSRRFEGRFGRMFRTLPSATFAEEDLNALAKAMTADPEIGVTPETQVDDEENFGIPAGYTYFGQFIDHDITFDPTSSLDKQNDPDALIDFRTPRLDLDSLYGRGPDDQPYMYDPNGRMFAFGPAIHGGEPDQVLSLDLPRFNGRALIGDKRNDENVIVSQLQGLFLRFHNEVASRNPELQFADVQRFVRWHHQWLVLYDFLPHIVGREQMEQVLPHLKGGRCILDVPPDLRFYRWHSEPFMPVEFSGAAYRFGHSMVRPEYRLSARDLPEVGTPKTKGLDGRKAIFAANPDDGLNGFRPVPGTWGIDWRLFFETRGGKLLSPKNLGKTRVQPAYKIDSSLVAPLGALPEFSRPNRNTPKPGQINALALRNLKRGMALGLPSAQSVAALMGIAPIPDDELLVGKANVDGLKTNPPIAQVGKSFAGNAPLWFYILAEAQHHWKEVADRQHGKAAKNAVHTRLGPIGGRIVAEVLVGLVLGDQNSFLNQQPNWHPEPPYGNPKARTPFDRFTVGDLALAVGTPR